MSGKVKRTRPMMQLWIWRYSLLLLATLLLIFSAVAAWAYIDMRKKTQDMLLVRATQVAELYSGVYDIQRSMNVVFAAGTATEPTEKYVITMQEGTAAAEKLADTLFVSVSTAVSASESTVLDEITVLGTDGEVIYTDAAIPATRPERVLAGDTVQIRIVDDAGSWYQAGVPIKTGHEVVGSVFLSVPVSSIWENLKSTYATGALFTLIIGIMGWLMIYLSLRRLTQPLRQLSAATALVAGGDYSPDLSLADNLKEAEVRELADAFREMTARLRQMESMRTDLLAGVSHELRTPLTSIRGMVQTVHDGVVKEEQAQMFLETTLEETQRMEKMVGDMLSFSSLESGAVAHTPERFDIAETARGVAAQLGVMPEGAACEISVEAPEGAAVYADVQQVRQILTNLIGNSCAAGADVVRITCRAENGSVYTRISDNGSGISEDDRENIFTRYYRGSRKKKRGQGLGLGLPLCRILAQANAGAIELVETSEAGSTFELILPAAQ